MGIRIVVVLFFILSARSHAETVTQSQTVGLNHYSTLSRIAIADISDLKVLSKTTLNDINSELQVNLVLVKNKIKTGNESKNLLYLSVRNSGEVSSTSSSYFIAPIMKLVSAQKLATGLYSIVAYMYKVDSYEETKCDLVSRDVAKYRIVLDAKKMISKVKQLPIDTDIMKNKYITTEITKYIACDEDRLFTGFLNFLL